MKLDATLERVRAANPAHPVATDNVALFDAIVASPGDARLSVRRSPWRRVSARVAIVVAVVALAVVITAVAFGLPQRAVDFFSSAPAPAYVVHAFATFDLGPTNRIARHVLAGETRRIITVRFNGRPNTLYVAPTKSGGFCFAWTGFRFGGCAAAGHRLGHGAGPLLLHVIGRDRFVRGWVRLGATRTLQARFADGTTATIPVTWVSAPINVGFVAYPVPRSHQDRAHAIRSVVALDADGRVIGRVSPRPWWLPKRPPFVYHTLPDGTKAGFPRDAEVAKARKIISFRASNGPEVYLWLVPLTPGGHCIVSNGAYGLGALKWICMPTQDLRPQYGPSSSSGPSPPDSNSVFVGGFGPGASSFFFLGMATPAVATVELRFQSGERERLTPIDGFVLHELGPAHWKRGTRLVAAVALNRNGKAISTERWNPQQPGIYP